VSIPKKIIPLVLGAAITLPVLAQEGSDNAAYSGHFYIGGQLEYLQLNDARFLNTPTMETTQPWMAGLGLGYQFNRDWAAELNYLSNLSGVSGSKYGLNLFRFWGEDWRVFVSGGYSKYDFDSLGDNSGDTDQAQLGFGVSRAVTDNVEVRAWWNYLYDVGFNSYSDQSVGVGLNYHFGRIRDLSPAVVAEPQPESVPEKQVALMTVELLVEFDFDKSDVRSVYRDQFDMVGMILGEYPEISITIEGHTDSRGTESYNQELSEMRAQAVKVKLVSDYSLDPGRIRTVGYGESRPIAENQNSDGSDNPDGRQRNRRAMAVFTAPER
jgi:outer membrane protein OmpA-like peptidoglycan-associated protein